MRRLRLIPALLVILLSACNEKLIEISPAEGTQTGEVVISLSSDPHTVAVKSGAEDEADMDNFWIEIFNSRKIRLFSQQYSSAKDEVIRLNSGEYRLLAKLGDSLGVGFDKAFYMADEPFTVHGQTKETVHAVARLANVKAAVTYGENIANFYPEGYYAVVRHNTLKGKSLKFLQDETRAGYIPAGELVLEVYAKIEGAWKYFAAPAEEYSPNDFVTFNVDVDPDIKGGLVINILVDNTVEVVEKSVEISPDALSAEAPYIVIPEFDENDSYYVYEGAESVSADNVSFSYSAKAGVQSCVLDIESEYLAGLGVPASVDFADLSDASLLEKAGFFWASSTTVGVIDLSGILSGIARNSVYESKDAPAAKFTLTVTDSRGKEAQQTAYIKLYPDAWASVDIAGYNVWARKIVEPGVSVQKGNMDKFTLEYSTDGSSWNTVGTVSSSGQNIVSADITGLNPDSEYQFRAVYDGWFVVSDVFTSRTESALQVKNAGFEEWHKEQMYSQSVGLAVNSIYRFYPWSDGADNYWDTVNSLTTPNPGNSAVWDYRSAPGVVPTSESSETASAHLRDRKVDQSLVTEAHSGNAAAEIATVGWGAGNTWTAFSQSAANKTAGQLFMGTYADGRIDYGQAFVSRPSSVSFWYKYYSYNNESTTPYVKVYDASMNCIGYGEMKISSTVNSFSKGKIDIDYSVKSKASYLTIVFSSTDSASPATKAVQGSKGAINGYIDSRHIGSIFTVDDIELIYE